MIIMIVIFLLLGLIEHVLSIQCYTCGGPDNRCTLPLSLDGGDESNENEVDTSNFNPDYACQTDYFYNPRTGYGRLFLRGIQDCVEINTPYHRVHCCYTNNCNRELPKMITDPLTNVTVKEIPEISNSQRSISSIQLIIFSIILKYFY